MDSVLTVGPGTLCRHWPFLSYWIQAIACPVDPCGNQPSHHLGGASEGDGHHYMCMVPDTQSGCGTHFRSTLAPSCSNLLCKLHLPCNEITESHKITSLTSRRQWPMSVLQGSMIVFRPVFTSSIRESCIHAYVRALMLFWTSTRYVSIGISPACWMRIHTLPDTSSTLTTEIMYGCAVQLQALKEVPSINNGLPPGKTPPGLCCKYLKAECCSMCPQGWACRT